MSDEIVRCAACGRRQDAHVPRGHGYCPEPIFTTSDLDFNPWPESWPEIDARTVEQLEEAYEQAAIDAAIADDLQREHDAEQAFEAEQAAKEADDYYNRTRM